MLEQTQRNNQTRHYHLDQKYIIKLASDVFHFNGSDYLLIVDYMSKFLIICQLSQTSKAVVEQMKSVFAEKHHQKPYH